MPIVSTAKMTANQFLQMGEDPPGVRLELVNGEIAVAPSPTPEHSICDNRFRNLLTNHVDENGLGVIMGDLDTPLDVFNVRRPDVLFFYAARVHLITKTKLLGPPDLCVEIISPSSVTVDRVDKFEQYKEAGVPFYWILDPITRNLKGFRLQRGRYVTAGEGHDNDIVTLPPFPKLQIPLGKLWWRPVAAPLKLPPARRRPRNGHRGGNGH